LYPSVPINTYIALRTTILPIGSSLNRTSPVLIPKGTAIVYSVYIIYKRPNLYKIDAKLYCPKRWDKDMLLNYNRTDVKWGYLPYNSGLRIYLGINFTLIKAAYVVI
ncbi:uncharacterized protein K441DRAFT_544582, partial [Cenococcum geophilum 1.58]|uniref:uncharacterized protein n=1 Tax=Cenococcum geophilum 1.58 TaxID=794803 RepID=UPI0035900DB9